VLGSDFVAAKIAGLEMSAVASCFRASSNIPGLHFPLSCMIDYKGFRVLASAVLPLSKGSLCYGSKVSS
jgi:hypothetical protein